MNFQFFRTLRDNVFTSTLQFLGYGNDDLSEDEEKRLLDDFGPLTIDIGGTFTGYYKIDAPTNALVESTSADTTAQVITFNINKQQCELDNGINGNITANIISNAKVFLTEDGNSISSAEMKQYTIITDPLKISEAKCLIFEKEINARIKTAYNALKAKKTDFETASPIHFEV